MRSLPLTQCLRRLVGLCHVRPGSDDLQEISNMTIINVALKLMGPTAEHVLTQRLLLFQVLVGLVEVVKSKRRSSHGW